MKQYTSSAHWPEDPAEVEALAAALMLVGKDALEHGITHDGWPVLAKNLQAGDDGEVGLAIYAWAVTLQDRAAALRAEQAGR